MFVWKIKINSLLKQRAWFKKWIIGKRTLLEISKESGKSTRTLQRLFELFLNKPPLPKIKPNNNCHLIIDGAYDTDFCVLNYLDNDQKHLQFYNIVKYESYDNYLNDLKLLKQSGLNRVW